MTKYRLVAKRVAFAGSARASFGCLAQKQLRKRPGPHIGPYHAVSIVGPVRDVGPMERTDEPHDPN